MPWHENEFQFLPLASGHRQSTSVQYACVCAAGATPVTCCGLYDACTVDDCRKEERKAKLADAAQEAKEDGKAVETDALQSERTVPEGQVGGKSAAKP